MFEFARRMKYLPENPINNIRITVKFRQIIKKTGKTQTYNTEEISAINEYLDSKYAETGDTAFMAVRVNFLMGLRVGELVALMWDDIEGIQIHVRCTYAGFKFTSWFRGHRSGHCRKHRQI